MKIPFDIKYRPQIESGEYKVETRDGRDARIICWDSKAKDARHDTRPIIALVTTPIPGLESLIQCGENGILYKDAKDRNDLIIITPEPELTEFEADVLVILLEFVEEVDANDVRRISKELLELAKNELCKRLCC